MRKKFLKTEEGQSIVEFSLILLMLINLLCIPIELFRFINLRTVLCSAATESLTQLKYESIKRGESYLRSDVVNLIRDSYGDRFEVAFMKMPVSETGVPQKTNYPYYVYSSELAGGEDPAFEHFEERDASYEYVNVKLQLSITYEPITYIGQMAVMGFLGDPISVKTPIYQTVVYASYLPEGGSES